MNCWQRLGLEEPTDDLKAIKRAYLAQLRTNRPEDDRENFQAIRSAYEAALAWAESPRSTASSQHIDLDSLPDWLLALSDQAPAKSQTESTPAHPQPPSDFTPEPTMVSHDGGDPAPEFTPPAPTADIPNWFAAPPRDRYTPPYQAAATLPDIAACRAEVWDLAAQGQAELAHKTLKDQLDGSLFSHLDARRALAEEWMAALIRSEAWPDGLAEEVSAAFDWDYAHDVPEDLQRRFRQYRHRHLLADIAAGTRHHDFIDRAAAQALLAPRLSLKRWSQSVEEDWHQRMHQALVWLQSEAPEALTAVPSQTLRWWRQPRPLESDSWKIMGLLSWASLAIEASHRLSPFQLSAWLLVPIMLVVIVTAAYMGFYLARGLAWIRVIWVVYVYTPWKAWDDRQLHRLVPRWPKPITWLYRRDIGPSRDILPFLLAFALEVVLLGRGEGWRQPGSILFITLFPSTLLWFFWRVALHWLAQSPGAIKWQQLQQGR